MVAFPAKAFHAFGVGDRARSDDVAGQAVWAEFKGDVGREGVDAGFGDRDVGLERRAGVVEGSGDEDYPATYPAGGGAAAVGSVWVWD